MLNNSLSCRTDDTRGRTASFEISLFGWESWREEEEEEILCFYNKMYLHWEKTTINKPFFRQGYKTEVKIFSLLEKYNSSFEILLKMFS